MSTLEFRLIIRHELDPQALAVLQAIAQGFGSSSNKEQLDRIERKLQSRDDATKTLFAQLNDATNAVAARLARLMALSDNADVKAGIQAEIDRLNAMGADPANPALVTT